MAKLEAHNLDHLSLESLMVDKRDMAARWHPPMALPSFYWSSYYYHSLRMTSTDDTQSCDANGRDSALRSAAEHTDYKQVLAEEAAVLRKQLEWSVSKQARTASTIVAGSVASAESQGLSVKALARRAKRSGVNAERVDAILKALQQDQGQAGSDQWLRSHANASGSMINLLVAHHEGQADRFMAKYFDVQAPPLEQSSPPQPEQTQDMA